MQMMLGCEQSPSPAYSIANFHQASCSLKCHIDCPLQGEIQIKNEGSAIAELRVATRLAMVAIAFWLIFASVGVFSEQRTLPDTPKHGIAKGEGSGKGQKQPWGTNSDQTSPSAVFSSPQPSTSTCDETCQQGRQNLQIQNRLVWLTGGLVVVGLLQVVSMFWQARLLKQTRGDIHTQAGWMKTQTEHMGRQTDNMSELLKTPESPSPMQRVRLKRHLTQLKGKH